VSIDLKHAEKCEECEHLGSRTKIVVRIEGQRQVESSIVMLSPYGLGQMSCSQGGEYEDDCLLEYCSVYSRTNWLTFQGCLLPPYSGSLEYTAQHSRRHLCHTNCSNCVCLLMTGVCHVTRGCVGGLLIEILYRRLSTVLKFRLCYFRMGLCLSMNKVSGIAKMA
jgi:hypothetical protein